jgi:hypothetical protein
MTSKQPNLLDSKLGHYKLTLERLSLSLASPYTQDKGNLQNKLSYKLNENLLLLFFQINPERKNFDNKQSNQCEAEFLSKQCTKSQFA